ncbi:MAG: hypothetical protein R3B54_03235 [Bdellovibrionota bacterium]
MKLSRGTIYYALTFLLSAAVWQSASVLAEEAGLAPGLPAPPSDVSEDQVKFYMGFPAFSGLVGTIAEVNQAMRDAAENPMDKWRRQNVQAAISKMPGAIRELASVFMSNELHNADLPPMQAMLGGFIDVNAADRYKKFMQHPDASLIPEAGPGFPLDLKAPPPTVTSAKIALSDPKFNQTSAAPKPSINPSEIADLSGVSAGAVAGTSSIGFNDDAPEGGASAPSSSTGAASGRGLASVAADSKDAVAAGLGFISSAIGRLLGEEEAKKDATAETAEGVAKPADANFLASVQKDLALLEGNYGAGSNEEEECVEGDEREECQEDGVFDLEAMKKKKKGPGRHEQGKGLRSAYKLKTQPKNWRAVSAVVSLLPTVKKASARPEDFSDDQLTSLANATGFTSEAQRRCAECEARSGRAACTSVCAPRDQFFRAVGAGSGNSGSQSSGAGGAGSGGGGGGRGASGGAGSAIAAAAAIAGSVGSAIALVGTTAAQANAAKSIATSKANEVVTNTKTKADATLYVANNEMQAKAAETQAIASLAKQKEAGKTFDTIVGISASLAASASARAARLDQAYFNRGVEKAQADLLMYVQAGQAALTEYAMKASAMVRGYVPNQLGPATLDPLGTGTVVASAATPPSSTILPGISSPGFRAVASIDSPVESPQSGLERVAAALRGSTRQNPVRIPQPAPMVRAITSFEGTPHVSSAERARAVSSFGASSRPTHTR